MTVQPVGVARAAGRLLQLDVVDALERGFAALAVFFLSGALVPLLRDGPDRGSGPSGPDSFSQLLFFGIYAVAGVLVAVRWRRSLQVLQGDLSLALLIGLALMSVVWSLDPSVTLRRSVAAGGTTLFGLYLSMRFSLRAQLRLLGWALSAAVVLSLVFVVFVPSLGVSGGHHVGAWRGIFTHKNTFGRYMAIYGLLAILRPRTSITSWFAAAGIFVLSAGLALMSQSISALVLLAGGLALIPVYHSLRLHSSVRQPLLIAMVLGASVAGMLVTDHLEVLLSLAGKDETMTGRTDLWRAVWGQVIQHPLLGWGYAAFWLNWNGPAAVVWNAVGWLAPHAHNGLLELWINLGLVGVVIFAAGFVRNAVRALAWLRQTWTLDGMWPPLLLSCLLLINVTSTVILDPNNLLWALYVATALSIHAQRIETRPPRARLAPAHRD